MTCHYILKMETVPDPRNVVLYLLLTFIILKNVQTPDEG